MNTKITYSQTVRLRSLINNQEPEEQLFERTIGVRYLKHVGQNATFYDPELKMHFENPTALGNVYELEISKVRLFPSKRLQKASELNRRLLYLYNWMQPCVGLNGKVRTIENKEEIKQRWTKLKGIFSNEYEGSSVELYLEKVDQRVNTSNAVWDCMCRYSDFGLVFTGIPPNHRSNFENKRLIEISEYENEKIEEVCTFNGWTDDKRVYALYGNTLPDSKRNIVAYTGELSFLGDNLLPEQCKVEVTYMCDNITSHWSFELARTII